MKKIEVHLFCSKSTTHPFPREERVHIFMRSMCKHGFMNGWFHFKDIVNQQPAFKIVNLDWRNEKAMIEIKDDLPWDVDDLLLCLSHEINFDKTLGFVAGDVVGGHFVHRNDLNTK